MKPIDKLIQKIQTLKVIKKNGVFSPKHSIMVGSQFFHKSGSLRDNLIKDTLLRMMIEIFEFENSMINTEACLTEHEELLSGDFESTSNLVAAMEDSLSEAVDVWFYVRSVYISMIQQLIQLKILNPEMESKIKMLETNIFISELPEEFPTSNNGEISELLDFLIEFNDLYLTEIKNVSEFVMNKLTNMKVHKYRFMTELEVLSFNSSYIEGAFLEFFRVLEMLNQLFKTELIGRDRPFLKLKILEEIRRRNTSLSEDYFYDNSKSIQKLIDLIKVINKIENGEQIV